jgi:hypothetical protein
LDRLPSGIGRKSLRYLHKICGRQALIPSSLKIEVHYNQKELALRGGFADVWKGRFNDQEVAVKVLRVYFTSDFELIRRVGYLQLVVCINELTAPRRGSARRL